jgi:uncharacterized protein (TIGR04255 family)
LLDGVSASVGFPRYLTLEERVPAEFQVELGPHYPTVKSRKMRHPPSRGGERTLYDFETKDGLYTISLASDRLTIKAAKYVCWEEFFPHVERPLRALRTAYVIDTFERISLYYQNRLNPHDLGLEDVPWVELVRPSLLGLLADPDLEAGDVVEAFSFSVVKLGCGKMRLGAGMAERDGKPSVYFSTEIISEGTTDGADEVLGKLGEFHTAANRAFRWLIRDRLDAALRG